MTIRFTDLTYADMLYAGISNPEFEIQHISWEIDEDSKQPMDIAICANVETLSKIADFSSVDWNIRSLDEGITREYTRRAQAWGATHEALYAQLKPFEIIGNCKVEVTEKCNLDK